ncbi:MAG: CPXCG motif-containing cysteine-rich protein [Dokdonella sp.]|uniref:CPXCG motif-containing cysteine-rich protein n=1 Tax=Dokdonella sp. TaxID=2291710 RepID=UPI002B93163E|nr:CPXCG motif-containing cysteine-rich protein [Xanthomonadales bacterium]HQV73392.1 CPXCG motif-containing cysteine-rich protein [Dokdonella sp.]MBK7209956.1 CPXCG motif-containing cysteine-rich protein [Xanthomonadales bacterium]MBL0222613.1 CPXCG motif-containing cysteine-rich protein [Xanthomonadales bacterium]HQW77554.1 CPXCG motif-containing cysteine-rich protein [Dokdonella sp.]
MLEAVTLHCPYCGESFESSVDCSAGNQAYIEDCAICCRPIEVRLRINEAGELLDVDTATDRE